MKFETVQTAKVMAILYFVLTAVICIPVGILSIAFHTEGKFGHLGGALMLFIPFLYAVIGFVMVAFVCVIYNWLTKFTGGIEFQSQKRTNEPGVP